MSLEIHVHPPLQDVDGTHYQVSEEALEQARKLGIEGEDEVRRMARSLSEDLRGRFVRAVASGAAGRRFAIAPTTAIRWAKVWRASGAQAPKPRGRPAGAGKLMGHADFLLALCREQGDMTLHEMAACLAEVRQVKVNPASLWRFFEQRGITWKKDRARRRAAPSPGEHPALGLVRATA